MNKITKWIRLHFYSKWVIPYGPYCYFGSRCPWDDTYKRCPYWMMVPSAHEQRNAYCNYLQSGDSIADNLFESSPSDVDYDYVEGIGLLWDQVKECGVNYDYEEDQPKTFFHKFHTWIHSKIYKVKRNMAAIFLPRNSMGRIKLSENFIDYLFDLAYEEDYKYIVILNSIMGRRLFYEDYSLQKSIRDIQIRIKFYQWDIERVISVKNGEDILCQ